MNETLQTIHQLRSIHGNFSAQNVSNADLETILTASVRAANASNRQSYSIIVVEERTKMLALCGYAASKALIFCVDFNRLIDIAGHLGHAFEIDSINMLITASIDASLAAQTAAIAARSLGIDCLFTNGIHRGDMQRVYDLLDLPQKYCFPLVALLLGYPLEEPAHPRGRVPNDSLVHFGSYHRLEPAQLDGIINAFDDPDTHLGIDFDREHFSRYLDWFFTAWSRRAVKTTPKSQMYAILEKAGFLEG